MSVLSYNGWDTVNVRSNCGWSKVSVCMILWIGYRECMYDIVDWV